MKGEDGLKTVECLRGRLLAERVVSRNAKQDTHLLENKLIELETQLKQEIKSRYRAERKLKFLMKKLNSLNISSDSRNNKSSKRDDISAQETLIFESDACFVEFITSKSHSEGSIEKENSSMDSNNYVSQSATSSQGSECPSAMEAASNSSGEASREKSSELEAGGYSENSNTSYSDDHRLETAKEEEEADRDNSDEGHDQYVDNSMALVPVDIPNTERTIDPVVLDATVKEVLDSLQRVKEKLQISMEQRRMVKVG